MGRRIATNSVIPPIGRRQNLWAFIACVVIILAGLATYSDSFHGPFIFDDRLFVTQPSARNLWPIGPVLAAQRPVAQATFALNYILGGPGEKGYRVVNVTVHLLAALALFGVVRRTLKLPVFADRFRGNTATALAFCTALLWELHPLQTEAVTFIIQRMESLMGLFYLLTSYCFIRAVSSAHPRAWYAASVACCLLGMGSKEVMVSAPLIVLLYDRAFVAGSFREALRRRWGLYLGLAATLVFLARSVIGAFGPRAETAGFALPGVTPLLYAQSQFGVILHYLRLAFWPSSLCLDYAWPVAHTAGEIAPGALVVGSLLAITIWALVRRKKWGFAGACFFLVLAPTSSIMPISDLAFEHRMYLPLAAIAAAAVVGAYMAGDRLMRRWEIPERARKYLGYGAAACAILLVAASLGRLTYLRNADYATEVGVWQDTARKRPENPHAWTNLADACLRAGDHSGRVLEYCEKAIALQPDFAEAYNNRGAVYAAQGRLAEAIRDYTKAISLRGNFSTAYCNRANARAMTNDFEAAIPDYDRAIVLNPDYAAAYSGRAYAHAMTHDLEAAIRDYDRAIALQPDSFDAYCNRGNAFASAGHTDEAIRDFSKAITLKPDSALGWYNRANAYCWQGLSAEALRDYDKAIALQPDFSNVYQSRAMLYYTLRDCGKAWADVKMCEKLGGRPNPDFLKALNQAAEPPKQP